MGKIICDICGTSYPDTAEQCPICGCTREAAAQMLGENLLLEDSLEEEKGKAGRFSSKKKKEIFDFDEVNSQPKEPEEEEGSFVEGEDEEEPEEEDRPNTFVVILLTVLIAALLIAAGFLFVKFILPNMGDKDAAEPPAQQSAAQTTPAGQTGSIPCETLVLSSGNKAVLTQEGGLFLLHVNAIPSDTTDVITFTSADESIATVSQDGRVEAVSEGETTVTITCGTKTIECQVIVQYQQETVAPTVDETAAPTEETVPETETTPVTTAPPDVKLKLKRTDISLGVGYEFQLLLDCGLEQDQVQWSSEHPHIVSVDENGVVKALKWGTTSVIAKYGDQEVSCIVRCS